MAMSSSVRLRSAVDSMRNSSTVNSPGRCSATRLGGNRGYGALGRPEGIKDKWKGARRQAPRSAALRFAWPHVDIDVAKLGVDIERLGARLARAVPRCLGATERHVRFRAMRAGVDHDDTRVNAVGEDERAID